MSTISSGPNPACARRRRSRLTTRRFDRRWRALSSSRERTTRHSRRCVCSIELEPGSTDLRNDAGVVHRTVGDFDTACDHFRSALALDRGNAKAALNLAKTKRFTARDDEDAHLIRAAARHPASTTSAQRDLDLALGKLHDDLGEWEAAFAHYEKRTARSRPAALEQVDESLALMDRMRTVFDSDWFATRPAASNPDPTPVFIVGMPRSGTTLVEQLLAAHPEVHGAGELSGILRLAARSLRMPAWTWIRCAPGVASMNTTPCVPAPIRRTPNASVRSGAAEIAALGERYLEHLRTHSSEAARISDKLPGNYLHLGFIATILPGAKIIYCRRDPLDNAISVYFTDFMAEHEYSNDLRAIGRLIRGMRALMTHWEAFSARAC